MMRITRARLSLSAQGFRGGGPGRAVTACLAVFTAGSPGHPRSPTGWAESLSGSLRRRVPGEDWVGPAGAVTTPLFQGWGRERWGGVPWLGILYPSPPLTGSSSHDLDLDPGSAALEQGLEIIEQSARRRRGQMTGYSNPTQSPRGAEVDDAATASHPALDLSDLRPTRTPSFDVDARGVNAHSHGKMNQSPSEDDAHRAEPREKASAEDASDEQAEEQGLRCSSKGCVQEDAPYGGERGGPEEHDSERPTAVRTHLVEERRRVIPISDRHPPAGSRPRRVRISRLARAGYPPGTQLPCRGSTVATAPRTRSRSVDARMERSRDGTPDDLQRTIACPCTLHSG